MTKYVILKKDADSQAWLELLPQEAASSRAAVRAYLNGSGKPKEDRGGVYVAVPVRSWKPLPPVVVVEALKFS